MVSFPNEFKGYQYFVGLLLGFRDNPSDVRQIEMSKFHMGCPPAYCSDGPRQIADILCDGKIVTCWKHHVKPVENKSVNR